MVITGVAMDSIYRLIENNLSEDGRLPLNFNILRIAQGEDYPPPEDDEDREFADGVRQGEFDAVAVRLPKEIRQHPLVNFRIAVVLKKAVESYAAKTGNTGMSVKEVKKAERSIASAKTLIDNYEAITIADRVLSHMIHIKTDRLEIAKFGRYLAKESDSVMCVKLGIAMVGRFGDINDSELLETLGRCEEFTHFSVLALQGILKFTGDFVDAAMELIRVTRGWGKVACILALPDEITNAEHRKYLLSHGAEVSVGAGHVAVEVAIKSGMGSYLLDAVDTGTKLSDEESKGACDIISGLFQAEPVKALDSFNELPDVGTVLSSFAVCVKNGLLEDERTGEIIGKLEDRNFIKKS